MPASGDASPIPPPGPDAAGAPREPDGPLDRLARLARRTIGVDTVIIACTDADGAWRAVAGAAPGPAPCPWSLDHPVRAADGRLLGTLRLLHSQTRQLFPDDRQALQDL